MIEELFRVVRDVNRKLPAQSRLRILLGDPPIDWNRIRTKDDWSQFLELRDNYPAALLQLEVIAKQRRALVLYGNGARFARRINSTRFCISAPQPR